eukprot:4924005-Amphidinium_carterae.1
MAVHQTVHIPSIPSDDMPPEVTGSAESETGEPDSKTTGLVAEIMKDTDVQHQEDKCTVVEEITAQNPQSCVSQPLKQTQMRTSTPPRYGDAGHKQTHLPDAPAIPSMDRQKPKQILPVLEIQEHSHQPTTLQLMPQAPPRKHFVIEIRSAAYLEQIRAARDEPPDPDQEVILPNFLPQPSIIPPKDTGRNQLELGTPASSEHQTPPQAAIAPDPLPTQFSGLSKGTGHTSPESVQQSSTDPQETTQASVQPQYQDLAQVTRVLLPSVVAVPPPAHSPRVALQEPFDNSDRTRKLLEMAHAALCPPLQHDHVDKQRQAQAPVGSDPRLITHVPKRTARRRAAAQLRDMERLRKAHEEEEGDQDRHDEE